MGARGRVSTMSRVARKFSCTWGVDKEAAAISESPIYEQDPTPTQAAATALDRRLQHLLSSGRILRGCEDCSLRGGGPHGSTTAWDVDGVAMKADNGVGVHGGMGAGGAGTSNKGGVIEWAKGFGLVVDASGEKEERSKGQLLEEAIVRHLVTERDAGLISTR